MGGGAAGLMAAIWAGRTAPGRTIVVLEGQPRLGAKLLVSGGGRCNVTHDVVDATAFAGSSPPAIRKVLGRFDVARTIAFFAELGVPLVREPTGKLFPAGGRARTVLDALAGGARAAGAAIRHPFRVETVRPTGDTFVLTGPHGAVTARRVVLATGGCSLPRSGSDGHGFAIARALGHGLTPHLLPALVPLRLPQGHPFTALAGVSAEATLEVRAQRGRRVTAVTGAVLCTHFGLSGPAVLDVSRWFLAARAGDPATALVACWLPGETPASTDAWLRGAGRAGPARRLQARGLPERLARALCALAGADPGGPADQLPRATRQALASAIAALPLPITGHRGFDHAEATAGGVPLAEVHLDTMGSRVRPGLFLCGELLDVDGPVGGYNFQWAWASGHTAGAGAARSL